jgi:hypothetical protein
MTRLWWTDFFQFSYLVISPTRSSIWRTDWLAVSRKETRSCAEAWKGNMIWAFAPEILKVPLLFLTVFISLTWPPYQVFHPPVLLQASVPDILLVSVFSLYVRFQVLTMASWAWRHLIRWVVFLPNLLPPFSGLKGGGNRFLQNVDN